MKPKASGPMLDGEKNEGNMHLDLDHGVFLWTREVPGRVSENLRGV
jgi:hypothetical protein